MTKQINQISVEIPTSKFYVRGKFGRMFPALPPCQKTWSEAKVENEQIAALMAVTSEPNYNMPAGYTYLGQFILHDITFDATTINERQVDPEFLWNFRTPAFDLDSLYGGGPTNTPYLYDGETHFFLPPPTQLSGDNFAFHDVPRVSNTFKTAIIADPRNDDNIVISQLHAAFLKFHNYTVDKLIAEDKRGFYKDNPTYLFLDAQQLVRWHFQWVILHDYLPRIIDLSEFKDLPGKSMNYKSPYSQRVHCARNQIKWLLKKNTNRKFYEWRNEPFIPLEFSMAAFRFGHSQVMSSYKFNPTVSESLFPEGYRQSKTPFARVDFRSFFPKGDEVPVPNRLIGPHISSPMLNIPGEGSQFPINIAKQNLMRGVKNSLPSGQRVAKAMGLKPLRVENTTAFSEFPEHLRDNTPLWYYILYEAQCKQKGERLGSVGSRIVAELIVGLIQGDKSSFFNQDPQWTPEDIYGGSDNEFCLADLLKMAGVYEPIKP